MTVVPGAGRLTSRRSRWLAKGALDRHRSLLCRRTTAYPICANTPLNIGSDELMIHLKCWVSGKLELTFM
jgi:hypothetical protein